MPVDKNVRGLKRCAARVKSIAVLEVAFQLEIELLRKFAGEIDPCSAQTESVFQRRLAKASLKRGNIDPFKIRLDEPAQNQLQLHSMLLDIYGRFLFFNDRFLDVRFPVVRNLLLQFPFRWICSLFGLQAVDLRFQFRVLFFQ